MTEWQPVLIGIASGVGSAAMSVAVLKNDVRWIKGKLKELTRRVERLESKA